MVPESTPTHTHVFTELGSEIFIGNWNSLTGVQSLNGLNLATALQLPKGFGFLTTFKRYRNGTPYRFPGSTIRFSMERKRKPEETTLNQKKRA